MDIIQSICELTEEEILSEIYNPLDDGAEWLNQGTYKTYFAIGKQFKPESMLEIGTRFGYSIESIYKGSGKLKHIFSFDSEYDFGGSQNYVYEKFKNRNMDNVYFRTVNTRHIHDLSLPFAVDIAHIDAEHSFQGTYDDVVMAFRYVKNNGIILIDDIENEDVKEASDQFCLNYKQKSEYVPCYRGIHIIIVNK